MTDLLTRARRGQSLADYGIIDMHGHLGRPDFTIPERSGESLVRVMDRVGIRTSVCAHMSCLSDCTSAGNDRMLEAMRAHPGRILAYVILWPVDARWVKDECKRRLGQGFVGIKLHNISGFGYDDPAYLPALEIANRRRLPVLFHTWGAAEEFEQLGGIAKRFPEANLLLAHTGCQNEEEYVRFANEHANVHLELCLSRSPRGLIERLVRAVPVEKIIWGSDALFLNMAQQLGKVVGADIPEEAKKVILSANAKRILSQAEIMA